MALEGAMTALVTPMRDGSVDFDALSALIDEQIDAGIDALVAVGTTGESATLSMREHIQVIKHFVHHAAGRVKIVAGAGANSTSEALELSRASAEAGADALLHVTPYYNKPTQDGMYRHFVTVADATELPVVLYNVSGRTGCDLLPATVERLADDGRFVALKEASPDMRRVAELVYRVGDRMAILSGDDFTAYSLFALGGRGVISVVGNVVPGTVAAMWDAAAARRWDEARALHYKMLPLVELLFAESNPIPAKAALELMGKIGPEIRAPLYPCSEPLRERLRAHLASEGLL